MTSQNRYVPNGQHFYGVQHFSNVGRYNKYKPHQGDQEIARRKSQIERGIIKIN